MSNAEQYTVENHNGVYVIDTPSELDSLTSDEFKTCIDKALYSPDCSTLVVDVSNSQYIDSISLGIFVSAFKKCKDLKKGLYIDDIGNPNTHVYTAFRITGLTDMFNILTEPRES